MGSEELLRAADPGLVADALEAGGVLVVGDEFAHEVAGFVRAALGGEEFGVLDLGAGVAVVGEDLLPGGDGLVRVAKGSLGFGEGHLGVSVVVLGIGSEGLFEEGLCLGGSLQAEQALAEVGDGVGIVRVALEGFAVAGLGFLELALGEEVVGEIEVIAGVVEVVDAVLDFLEAGAVARAREFEAGGATSCGSLRAVDHEEVEDRREDREQDDAHSPDPLAAPDGVHGHPEGEDHPDQNERILQQYLRVGDIPP